MDFITLIYRRVVFILLLTLVCITSFAQSNVKTYTLPDSIKNLMSDSCIAGHYILLISSSLDNNGSPSKNMRNMILFNLQKGEEQWRMPFNKEKANYYFTTEGLLFTAQSKTSLLRYEDGTERWKKKGILCDIEPKHNTFFFYLQNAWNTKLEYCDTKTGTRHWAVTMAEELWLNKYNISDSTICVRYNNGILQGLHLINLRNGEMKSHDAMSEGLFNKHHSNLIYEDGCIYMSDKQKLFCLDSDLNEVWKVELPRKSASSSYIYSDSTNIYMINSGMGSDFRLRGYPFVAAYSKQDGQQTFFTQMADAKNAINDFFRIGDTQFMIFDDCIAGTQLKENTTIRKISWDAEKYGKLSNIVELNIYVADADNKHYHKLSPEENLMVKTQKQVLCTVDPVNMIVMDTYEPKQYFAAIHEDKDKAIITDGHRLLFINSKGEQTQVVDNILWPTLKENNHIYAIATDRTKLLDIQL